MFTYFLFVARQAWNPNANKSVPATENISKPVTKEQVASPNPSQSTSNYNAESVSTTNQSNKTATATSTNNSAPSSQNVQSTPVSAPTPSAPSSTFTATHTTNSSNIQKPIEEIQPNPTSQIQQKPIEKPRVGVLLPGNFANDDSMSFQFGNLGILEDDLVATRNSVIDTPDLSNTQNTQTSNSSRTTKVPEVQSNKNDQSQSEHENNPSQMNPHYSQFPMYPMDSDHGVRGHPMVCKRK